MPRLKASGLSELKKGLKARTKTTDIQNVVRLNASEMQKKAKNWALVDTGDMKRGIELNIRNKGMTGEIDAVESHSPYIEYGTRFFPYGMPFIRPAFHTQKILFMRDMERLMK